MKSRIFFFLFLFFSHLLSAQQADRVFINGKIYTANDAQPFAEALAIKDNLILFVGSNTDINQHIGSSTVVEDLDGRLILPGIHDVHMHPLEAGSLVYGDCLLDPYEWYTQDLVTTLANCNLEPNENGWILAYGHSIFTLLEGGVIPRFALDQAFPDVPVAVLEETSHSVWVNSKGLEMAGIDANTPDPVGGHIMKLGNGTIIGVLLDNAGDLVLHQALASNPVIDALNYNGLIEYSLPLMARNGITSACEARTYWKRNYLQIWQDVQDNGLLTCRMVLTPWVYPEDEDAEMVPILQSMYQADDNFLRINQLKVYSDGISINATAALLEPYDFNWGLPFDTGLNYIEVNRLSTLISTLETTGYDFHIHAIGDRGVTEGLNAIEFARNQNGDIGARHRITHLEFVDPADFPRFEELNVTADMQVAGYWTEPQYWGLNEDFVGAERSENFIPLKFIYDNNARVTLSSDWDVSTLNPFHGMQNALTRAPQEMPSVEAVVKAYTIHGAYLMRQDQFTGSLEVGKWADFICVNQDIFTIPQNQIALTKVLCTWVDGTEVYRSDELPVISNLTQVDETDKLISLSPNPGSNYVLVKSQNGNMTAFEVYTSAGELIWTENAGKRDSFTANLSGIPPGTYFISIQLENGSRVIKKFVRID
ncbi:MAG: amidohydrolase family protein [Saprospiraceae bacterium]|nr:amidohydrolase family protein [Saprospiraceae bacterium]